MEAHPLKASIGGPIPNKQSTYLCISAVQKEAHPLKASIDIVKEGPLLEMSVCCYLKSSISLPSVIVVFGSPRKRAHDSLASQIAPGKLSYLESWFSK